MKTETIIDACHIAQAAGEEVPTDVARAIAGQWHSGQGSAFYAFSSSGYFDRADLDRERERTMAQSYASASADDRLTLDMLATFILSHKGLRVWTLTFTEDDIHDGDIAYRDEREEYLDCTPDAFDREDGLDAVACALKILQDRGLTQPSSSHPGAGDWLSDPDGSTIVDYGTGEREEVSAHFEGFTNAEVRDLFARLRN